MVIVAAPATSTRGFAGALCVSGTIATDSANTATPIGKLTRNIQCQFNMPVSIPPSIAPTLPPPATTKP